MRRRCGAVLATVVMASLAGAPNAAAGTEVGNDCQGTAFMANTTLVQIARAPGSQLPPIVPAAGIVTKWKVNAFPFAGSQLERLKVLRDTGAANEFQVVDESAPAAVTSGENVFEARVPVQQGDRFGVYGGPAGGALYCATLNPGDTMGTLAGDASLGGAFTFTAAPEFQAAVSAIVEADRDGDGYGDDTQDECPQSSAFQGPCPLIKLSSTAIARRGSVSVFVTASPAAAVTVVGIAYAGKKGSRAPGRFEIRSEPQTASPGELTAFTLALPAKLKSKLAKLPRKRSLRMEVTASAANLRGIETASTTIVKLKGQAPARPRR